MTAKLSPSQHGIKDNHSRGTVADYLAAKLAPCGLYGVVPASSSDAAAKPSVIYCLRR